jgi:hypothetical protein
MAPLTSYAVSVCAAVTATAAIAAAKWARDAAQEARINSRILRGEETVDEWDGIVDMVHEHREALRGADLLNPADADRDEVEA